MRDTAPAIHVNAAAFKRDNADRLVTFPELVMGRLFAASSE
jgi:hypothetical protein